MEEIRLSLTCAGSRLGIFIDPVQELKIQQNTVYVLDILLQIYFVTVLFVTRSFVTRVFGNIGIYLQEVVLLSIFLQGIMSYKHTKPWFVHTKY